MKKISSKIIISLVLAAVLWGGVNIFTSVFAASVPTKEEFERELGYTLTQEQYAAMSRATIARDSTRPGTIPTQAEWEQQLGHPVERTAYEAARRAMLANGRTLDETTSGNLYDSTVETLKNGWGTAVDFAAGIVTLWWFAPVAAALLAILSLLAGFVSIAAAIFDGIVHLSIGGFRSFVDSSNIIESWTLIRDTINICFIFVLLYIAITTIIGGAGVKTKVSLKNVIVGALLINFSMFFASIIIDGGNLLAEAIYNKLNAASGNLGVWGLSGKIFNGLNLTGLWNPELIKASGQLNAIFILVLSIILVSLTLWAFMYAAILFLVRNVILLFLIAVSPIGFIGGTLPWFEKKASEWWSSLINQVMVAPFFLFIMYILIRLTDSSSKILKLVETKSFWSGSTGLNYAMYINAFLIIGLLVIGIKTTKKLSGKMGDMTEKFLNIGLAAGVAAITGGASALATRGAAMARLGATRAASGGAAARISGAALQARGRGMQIAGNLVSGQYVRDAAGQPTRLGVALTDARDSIFKSAKKEAGIDLDAAFKYKDKMDKEYEKRYGEIANKIGGKKDRAELDVLNNISKNIQAQAENRHKRDPVNKAAWEQMEAMTDLVQKRARRAQLTAAMKTDIDTNLAPAIAREMGVDLRAHEAKKEELKITIENKTIKKNEYAATIPDKKIADMIRSQATYEAKDKVEDDLAKMIKKLAGQNSAAPNNTAPNP
jgi:hypothetical protein